MAKDYNKTIHLPQTDFPMRAGLPKREPALLNGEYEVSTYHKLMEHNAEKPSFVLHDGPPYANGDIHIGTALNKILKDMIVRYKNMTGYKAPYIPGWDTHGLPIESAILKNKKIKRDELSDVEFRDKCREYALSFVDRQRSEFQHLGVIGDWDNPYLTLKPEFEAAQIRVFGKMAEKGYIYKGLKPVYWCYTDETALAEAENGQLVLPQKGGQLVLEKREISHLERRLRVTKLYLTDGQCVTTALGLEELLERLGDPAFLRCHNSFAVSLDHAAVFRRESFLMKDGTVVPISHGYYPAVREQFRKYHHIEL